MVAGRELRIHGDWWSMRAEYCCWQMRRYLPMPDYDLSKPSQVRLTIHGAVTDEAYTSVLMQHTDLPLSDVLALDRVQKGLRIPSQMVTRLRRQGLIDGRQPHLRVSGLLAQESESRVELVQARNPEDLRYLRMIVDHLDHAGESTRQDIDALLAPVLPSSLTAEEARELVSTLLVKLRRDGHIHNTGTRAHPVWSLTGASG